jgi:site-specific recombinase XerD
MYSPKIKEEYIPVLYKIAKGRGVPMTHIVREALEEYLNKQEVVLRTQKGELKNDD